MVCIWGYNGYSRIRSLNMIGITIYGFYIIFYMGVILKLNFGGAINFLLIRDPVINEKPEIC